MHSTKIASVNINGISTQTRVGMLRNFIRHHELDFIFFQKVTEPAILTVTGYKIYLNIREKMRGTAIMAKQDNSLTNVTSVLTVRTISTDSNGLLW
jgi:exonuclease III